MIIEGDYFYKGAARLSWGFGSPNQLGAFVTGLLPVAWGVAKLLTKPRIAASGAQKQGQEKVEWPSVGKLGAWAVESALWLAIGATASRGAVVAALLAAGLWAICMKVHDAVPLKSAGIWFIFRIAMGVFGLALFSFGGRISPDYLIHDDSIGNRFILWKGALSLLAAAPWHGWGVGESGSAFMQWIQPLGRHEGYRTMVNSYLHFAVEGGVLPLTVAVFLTIVTVLWALRWEDKIHSRVFVTVARAASCILLSWAASNVFSTLFKDWRLWVLPALAALGIVASAVALKATAYRAARWLFSVLAAALLTAGALLVAGRYYNSRAEIAVLHPSAGLINLVANLPGSERTWAVVADKTVLGKHYGQELRRWMLAANQKGQRLVLTVWDLRFGGMDAASKQAAGRWILIGEAGHYAESLDAGQDVVFLHPRGRPPAKWSGKGIVVFNEIDEDGSREAWSQWASRKKIKVREVAGIGLDARSQWPAAYLGFLENQQ